MSVVVFRGTSNIADLDRDADILANLNSPFELSAEYDPDGDCIEFFADNVPFNAKRLDDWVTMYVAEADGRLVGCLVKRVKRLLHDNPNLQEIVIEQVNKLRLDYYFVARAARMENIDVFHQYNELKHATQGMEVPLPCAAAA
jgi:hypothetical protein